MENKEQPTNPYLENYPGATERHRIAMFGSTLEKAQLAEAEAAQTENPYLIKAPSLATRMWVKQNGTARERKFLAEYEFAQLSPKQQAKQREFIAKLGEPAGPAEDNGPKRLKDSLGRMFRMMNKRSVANEIPKGEMYAAARRLIFSAYAKQVEFETGEKPVLEGRTDIINALHQLAHWLAGDDPGSAGAKCDCEKSQVELIPINKSIYLVGPLGTGKSTIAQAAHFASIQLHGSYNTGMRLGYTSLDEMIVSVYANQNLKPVEEASKGSMVLDEVRAEHIGYKHYGNDVRILADILLVRHHAWKQTGAQTIITTNLPPADLVAQISDARLTDRMIQQYYPLWVEGKSLRPGTAPITPAAAPQTTA